MLRTQEKVPSVYVEESRDFQVFCRLFDYMLNSIRYDSSGINYTSIETVDERLLYALGSRVNLKTTTDNVTYTRSLLSVYSDAMKYKGSIQAIRYVLNAFLRLLGLNTSYRVIITNASSVSDEAYTINVLFNTYVPSRETIDYLTNILSLFINPGYRVYIGRMSTITITDTITLRDDVTVEKIEKDWWEPETTKDDKFGVQTIGIHYECTPTNEESEE